MLDILQHCTEMRNKTKKFTIYIIADNPIWSGWWQEWEDKEAEERKVYWHHHRWQVCWQKICTYLLPIQYPKSFDLSRVTYFWQIAFPCVMIAAWWARCWPSASPWCWGPASSPTRTSTTPSWRSGTQTPTRGNRGHSAGGGWCQVIKQWLQLLFYTYIFMLDIHFINYSIVHH